MPYQSVTNERPDTSAARAAWNVLSATLPRPRASMANQVTTAIEAGTKGDSTGKAVVTSKDTRAASAAEKLPPERQYIVFGVPC